MSFIHPRCRPTSRVPPFSHYTAAFTASTNERFACFFPFPLSHEAVRSYPFSCSCPPCPTIPLRSTFHTDANDLLFRVLFPFPLCQMNISNPFKSDLFVSIRCTKQKSDCTFLPSLDQFWIYDNKSNSASGFLPGACVSFSFSMCSRYLPRLIIDVNCS